MKQICLKINTNIVTMDHEHEESHNMKGYVDFILQKYLQFALGLWKKIRRAKLLRFHLLWTLTYPNSLGPQCVKITEMFG